MIRPSLRLGAVTLVLAAIAVLSTACSSTPEPEPTQSSAAPTATTAPEPEVTAEPTTEPAATPTCEELISDTMVADFTAVGWTVQEEVFRVGSLEIAEGVLCRWGDFTTASDHLQMFGWAPITAADASSVRSELVAGGWIEEEDGGVVYVTESPDTALQTDADGYGATYQFGDGWVKFADTKQSLLLLEWPKA